MSAIADLYPKAAPAGGVDPVTHTATDLAAAAGHGLRELLFHRIGGCEAAR